MNDWREQLSVPRDQFIPSVVWIDDPTTDGFVSVSKMDDEARWWALVDSDEPIITQVDDGNTPSGRVGLQPSSSCSQPSLVAGMLDALDVHAGHRVLEIGTGTGWNAALLSERVGEPGNVVSVELDSDIADQARRALVGAGYATLVVSADGMQGYAPGAPYDRVIATASVRVIPRAWIDQTRPGGVIVVPWGTDYCNGTLLRLDVHNDGSASGRCGTNLAFMRIRGQRRDYLEPSEAEQNVADRTTTLRSVPELFDMIAFSRAAFAIGLRVPRCYLTVEEINSNRRIIELHDVHSHSWARVDLVRGADTFDVYQLGPRRLWDKVDAAYAWWIDVERPTHDRFGLTVTPDGAHSVWLDTPDSSYGWPLDL
ncbi:MAG: methyltransferase domain-containing protein [Pseudonocardiales bacterium]